MSAAKHTAGPWEYRLLKVQHDITNPHGASVAYVHGGGQAFNEATQWANARLIAAAPEMLEALSIVARYIEPTAVDALAMQRIAREAIAKATGGAA